MFSLLAGNADWSEHCRKVCQQLGISSVGVQWGDGPQSYPCLVASLRVEITPRQRFATCYVYPNAAKHLLEKAGMLVSQPAALAASAGVTVGNAEPRPVEPAAAPGGFGDLGEFQRCAAANFLAIAYYLVETGICSEQAYEGKFQAMLACVDRYSAEDRERALKTLASTSKGGHDAG